MDPITTGAITAACVLLAFALFTFIFRLIWNATMPAVFGTNRITFWQAVGLLVLASILFGGHRVINTEIPGLPKKTSQAAFHQPA